MTTKEVLDFDERARKYIERLKDVYSDGNVSTSEREELKRLQKEYSIPDDMAKDLEKPFEIANDDVSDKKNRLENFHCMRCFDPYKHYVRWESIDHSMLSYLDVRDLYVEKTSDSFTGLKENCALSIGQSFEDLLDEYGESHIYDAIGDGKLEVFDSDQDMEVYLCARFNLLDYEQFEDRYLALPNENNVSLWLENLKKGGYDTYPLMDEKSIGELSDFLSEGFYDDLSDQNDFRFFMPPAAHDREIGLCIKTVDRDGYDDGFDQAPFSYITDRIRELVEKEKEDPDFEKNFGHAAETVLKLCDTLDKGPSKDRDWEIMADYTRDFVKFPDGSELETALVNSDLANMLKNFCENALSTEEKPLEITGVRLYRDPKKDGKLSVLLEYKGEWREDDLFNVIAEEAFEYEGYRLDVNPITPEKSGTIDEYLLMLRNAGARDEGQMIAENDRKIREQEEKIGNGINPEVFLMSGNENVTEEEQKMAAEKVNELLKEKHGMERDVENTTEPGLNELTWDDVQEKLEDLGYRVNGMETNGNMRSIEIEFTSDAGEDVIEQLYCDRDRPESVSDAFRNLADDFDIDEHVKLNLNVAGAPDVSTLVDDAESIKKTFQEDASLMKEFVEHFETPYSKESVRNEFLEHFRNFDPDTLNPVGGNEYEFAWKTLRDAKFSVLHGYGSPRQKDAMLKEYFSDIGLGDIDERTLSVNTPEYSEENAKKVISVLRTELYDRGLISMARAQNPSTVREDMNEHTRNVHRMFDDLFAQSDETPASFAGFVMAAGDWNNTNKTEPGSIPWMKHAVNHAVTSGGSLWQGTFDRMNVLEKYGLIEKGTCRKNEDDPAFEKAWANADRIYANAMYTYLYDVNALNDSFIQKEISERIKQDPVEEAGKKFVEKMKEMLPQKRNNPYLALGAVFQTLDKESFGLVKDYLAKKGCADKDSYDSFFKKEFNLVGKTISSPQKKKKSPERTREKEEPSLGR